MSVSAPILSLPADFQQRADEAWAKVAAELKAEYLADRTLAFHIEGRHTRYQYVLNDETVKSLVQACWSNHLDVLDVLKDDCPDCDDYNLRIIFPDYKTGERFLREFS